MVNYTLTVAPADNGAAVLRIEPPKWNAGQVQHLRLNENRRLSAWQRELIAEAVSQERPASIACASLAQAELIQAWFIREYAEPAEAA